MKTIILVVLLFFASPLYAESPYFALDKKCKKGDVIELVDWQKRSEKVVFVEECRGPRGEPMDIILVRIDGRVTSRDKYLIFKVIRNGKLIHANRKS